MMNTNIINAATYATKGMCLVSHQAVATCPKCGGNELRMYSNSKESSCYGCSNCKSIVTVV